MAENWNNIKEKIFALSKIKGINSQDAKHYKELEIYYNKLMKEEMKK